MHTWTGYLILTLYIATCGDQGVFEITGSNKTSNSSIISTYILQLNDATWYTVKEKKYNCKNYVLHLHGENCTNIRKKDIL